MKTVSFLRHLRAFGSLPFVVTVIIPSILYKFSSWTITDNASNVLGAALYVFGLSILLYTNVLFHYVGEGTLAPFDPPTKFVARGLYCYTRNPMIGMNINIFD